MGLGEDSVKFDEFRSLIESNSETCGRNRLGLDWMSVITGDSFRCDCFESAC